MLGCRFVVFGFLRAPDTGGSPVVEAGVAQPEHVETGFVVGGEFVVGVALEAFSGLPLVAAAGFAAGHEIVEISPGERVLFEGEVFVGAQVVHPEFLRPGARGAGLLIVNAENDELSCVQERGALGTFAAGEEHHIGFHTLGVEDTRRQTQHGMHFAVAQQASTYGRPGTGFKQYVVGHHHMLQCR